MSCSFKNQSPFFQPKNLVFLVRDLLREDSVENNQERVRTSLEAIVSFSETMLRELAEAEAERVYLLERQVA